MNESARFLILRKIKYGESDLIIQALSSRGEKKSFLARGAVKSKKRFGGGVLEPLHFCEFLFQKNRSSELYLLKEATLIEDFPGLRQDYDRLDFALRILECTSKVSQEGETDNARLFQLVGHALGYLEKTQELSIFKIQFYLKLLFQQGVLSPENWMLPFLRTSLDQSYDLTDKIITSDQIKNIEYQVQHYIDHAESISFS